MIKSIQIAYYELFELKCQLAAKAGFRHISVNFHDMVDFSDRAFDAAPDHIQAILEKTGLTAVQTHLPYYSLLISAEELYDDFERKLHRSIEVGSKIGAFWNVYHPRSAINADFSTAASFEINKRVISGYLETAAKFGGGVALENLPIFGFMPIMPFYSFDYHDLCQLHDAFATDNVGICWDTGHANQMRFDQVRALRAVGHRLKNTHINDNHYGTRDEHLQPFMGTIDWFKVMAVLAEIGYDGDLAYETNQVGIKAKDELQDAILRLTYENGCYLMKIYDEALAKLNGDKE